jgi:hypothetical protein
MLYLHMNCCLSWGVANIYASLDKIRNKKYIMQIHKYRLFRMVPWKQSVIVLYHYYATEHRKASTISIKHEIDFKFWSVKRMQIFHATCM